MKIGWAVALLPVACLAVAGCRFGLPGSNPTPTGQVVATYDGQEITTRQIDAELGSATFPDAKTRHAAEEQALNQILTRKVLADDARKQGLDKTPDFALQKDRVIDALLGQLLQNKIVAAVPPPTVEQAQQFMADHSDIFAQRKIWALDQIRFSQQVDPAIAKAIEPLDTMQQVQDLLTARHIPFQRAAGSLDAVGADPRLIDDIAKLKPGELFMVPQNGVYTVNQITDTRIQPIGGQQAQDYAMLLLRRQHAEDAAQREFASIFQAAKAKIKINKAYQEPTAPAQAGKPAAPAAGQS